MLPKLASTWWATRPIPPRRSACSLTWTSSQSQDDGSSVAAGQSLNA